MAVYSIVLKRSAAREIDDLPTPQDRRRVVARIKALGEEPRPRASEKLAWQENRYRVRQGRYRIVYSIEDAVLTVVVVKAADRKEVYR